MRISYEVQGVEQSAERIEGGYYRSYLAALKETGAQMLELREYALHNTMHGQIVNHKSGNLARNTTFTVEGSGETITGRVGIRDDDTAPYARILHQGGTTRAHVITASEGKKLAFMAGGQMIFRKRVNHPGSKFPPRPYLAAALEARKEQIKAAIVKAVEEGM